MKGQDKPPKKQLDRQPSRLFMIQNNHENDLGSQKYNEKMQKNVYRRTKEQTNRVEQYSRKNRRITEAEEQINDLEDRMVEITSAEQNMVGGGGGEEWKKKKA